VNGIYRWGDGAMRVLALHGWFGNGSAGGWGELPGWLGAGYSWAAFDFRGYGARIDEQGRFTIAEIASDAIAVADELGWETFALIGHSMGGKAAFRVLAEAPQRVTSVIGVTPVPATAVAMDEETQTLFSSAASNRDSRVAIVEAPGYSRLTPAFVDSIVNGSLEHSTIEAFGRYFHSWSTDDFSQTLKGLDQPALALVGEHDPSIDVELMEVALAPLLQQFEVEVIPGSGHYPMFETPIALAVAIRRFHAAVAGR
jgi:pimeloyl-ACP methyl ester carboxylesterase